MYQKAIIVSDHDDVSTAIEQLRAGEHSKLHVGHEIVYVELTTDIPAGHEFALKDISEGEPCRPQRD